MNLQEINQIYNGLEVKDIPRHEFVKQVQDLINQSGVQRDLGKIMAGKRMVAKRKQKIDMAIAENG